MASYDDSHSMNIPSEEGSIYSYGAIQVDSEDIIKVEEIDYTEDHLPSLPISAILQEGVIAHIELEAQFNLPEVEENNPYHIREINHTENPREIICQSISNGVLFIQRSSRSSGNVKLEVCMNNDEVRRDSGEYNPTCVLYDLLPDELICQELDVSSEIMSRLL